MDEMEQMRADFVAAIAQLTENVKVLSEAVTGYRADLEAKGFSPTAAEAMSMEYHTYLMVMLANAAPAQ